MVLNADTLQTLRREHGSLRRVAEATGLHHTTVSKLWRDFGLPAIGHDGRTAEERLNVEPSVVASTNGDEGAFTVTGGAELQLGDLERMLVERGLEPEEWEVERVRVNEWTGADGRLCRQLRADLRRRRSLADLGLVGPAAIEPLPFKPRARVEEIPDPLVVLTGCWQYPYADERFEACFLAFLDDVRPDLGIDLGDGMDLPSISRHRDNPAFGANAQACVDAYGGHLYRRAQASPDTAWRLLKGNHDDRFRNEILQRAERLAMIRPAEFPGEHDADLVDAFSLRRLLRLDELGIELVEAADGGSYPHASIAITPRLVAIHGEKTDARGAAAAHVRQFGTSVVMAHTHRQRLYSVRLPRGVEAPEDAVGVEVGCGCRIDGGLGYAVRPDWANGFATVKLDDSGGFSVEFARYSEGVLRWRDLVFRA